MECWVVKLKGKSIFIRKPSELITLYLLSIYCLMFILKKYKLVFGGLQI